MDKGSDKTTYYIQEKDMPDSGEIEQHLPDGHVVVIRVKSGLSTSLGGHKDDEELVGGRYYYYARERRAKNRKSTK